MNEDLAEDGGQRRGPALVFIGCLLVALAYLAYTVGVFKLFPPELLHTQRPIVHYDYPLHLYQAETTRRFYDDAGGLWGYDPQLLAGKISNVFLPDNNLVNAIALFAPADRAVKWTALLMLLSAPFLVACMCRLFGLRRSETLIAFAMFTLLVHTDYFFRGLAFRWGMFSFFGATLISAVALGCFVRALAEARPCWWAGVFVLTPLGLLTHALAGPTMLAGYLFAIACNFRRLNRRAWILLVSAGLVTALVNAYWIVPFLRYRRYFLFDEVSHLMQSSPLKLLRDVFVRDVSPIFVTVIFVGGLYSFLRAVARKSVGWWVLALGGLAAFCLMTFGTQLGQGGLQPYRFRIVVSIFWLPGAAVGFRHFLKHYRVRQRYMSEFVFIALALMLIGSLFTGPLYNLYTTSDVLGADTYPPEVAHHLAGRLVSWQRANPLKRALVARSENYPENSYEFLAVNRAIADGVNVVYVPSGPHSRFALIGTFRNARRPTIFFGKKLSDWTPGRAGELLRDYAIGFVASGDREFADFIECVPGVRRVSDSPPFGCFEVDGAQDMIDFPRDGNSDTAGAVSPVIKTRPNEIMIENVPMGADVLLRFNWVPELKLHGAGEIGPVEAPNRIFPFIRLSGLKNGRAIVRFEP